MARRLTDEEWAVLIEAHPELAELPADLRRLADHIEVAAGSPVFRLGARPARILWVLQGEVRLVRRSRNGAEIVLQRAYSGFVAEASIQSHRYHCDAVAVVDSRLLGFPIEPFRQALRHDTEFQTFWMNRLAREVRLLRSQCERLALRSATDRIEHYIESEGTNGRLQLSRTRKAWAAELGVTHEALYRALASLRRSGRISAVESEGGLVLTLNADHGVK